MRRLAGVAPVAAAQRRDAVRDPVAVAPAVEIGQAESAPRAEVAPVAAGRHRDAVRDLVVVAVPAAPAVMARAASA